MPTTNEKQRHRNQAQIRARLQQDHQAGGLPEFSYRRAIARLIEWGIYSPDELIKPAEIATICAHHDTDTALMKVREALEALELGGVLVRASYGKTYNPRYRLAIAQNQARAYP